MLNTFDERNQLANLLERDSTQSASFTALKTRVTALEADNPPTQKVYIGEITQSGTSTPTLAVILNTFGVTLTASYGGIGVYRILASTAQFTANKTICDIQNMGGANIIRKIEKASTTCVKITCASGTTGKGFASVANALVTNTPFSIRVFV